MFTILKNEKGLVMPLVLMLMVVTFLLGITMYIYSTSEITHSSHEESRSRAHYIARAAAESVARYIMENPALIDELVPEEKDIADADSFVFESKEVGDVGDIAVELKRLDEFRLKISGEGTVDEITKTVNIKMEAVEPFDGVVYSASSVNFQNKVEVIGDLVSGGEIMQQGSKIDEHPNEDEDYEVQHNQLINFPEPAFPEEPEGYSGTLEICSDKGSEDDPFVISSNENNPPGDMEDPPGENEGYEEIDIRQNGYLRIDANKGPIKVETNELDMHRSEGNYAQLALNTHEDYRLQLVVNQDCNLGTIRVKGDGLAELYIRSGGEANYQTPNPEIEIIEDPGAKLIIFLEEGSKMEMQGNSEFEGLIYGPEAYVEMGSNSIFEGVMIVEQLKAINDGNKSNIQVMSAGEIKRKYSWSEFDDIFGRYRIIQWSD